MMVKNWQTKLSGNHKLTSLWQSRWLYPTRPKERLSLIYTDIWTRQCPKKKKKDLDSEDITSSLEENRDICYQRVDKLSAQSFVLAMCVAYWRGFTGAVRLGHAISVSCDWFYRNLIAYITNSSYFSYSHICSSVDNTLLLSGVGLYRVC